MNIFVTTGTQKFQFDRLIEAVDKHALLHPENSYFVQSGASSYTPKSHMQCSDYLDRTAFRGEMDWADVIITHGGAGAIIGALKKGVPTVAVPRRSEYNEHVDNHQEEIVTAFEREGYLVGCYDLNHLDKDIDKACNMQMKRYVSHTKEFIEAMDVPEGKICFASSSGGHTEQTLTLMNNMNREVSFLVTEKVDYDDSRKGKTHYLTQVNRKELGCIFKLAFNALVSLRILVREKPDIIVTTGVLAVIPLCLLAKMLRKKLIYIESFADITSPTLTGKLLYKYADRFYIQWEDLYAYYPKAEYIGSIY